MKKYISIKVQVKITKEFVGDFFASNLNLIAENLHPIVLCIFTFYDWGTGLVIVLATTQFPEKLPAHMLLQKCGFMCGSELSGLIKLGFINLCILDIDNAAMKHSCERKFETKKFIYTDTHVLYRTQNTIFSEKNYEESLIFFIRIAASYIFHYLKHESITYCYQKGFLNEKLNAFRHNLFAQKINLKLQIYVNIDHMLGSMTLIHLCDNIYSIVPYYIETYVKYENTGIITYHDMISTNKDENEMGNFIKNKYDYYAIMTYLFWFYIIIKKNYWMLEWLDFHNYFTLIKYERKKYNE